MVTINLYKLMGEKTLVDKSGADILTPPSVYQITGEFRENVDVMHPSIILNYDGVPDFNYIRIAELNRYYFVDNYTFIRTGLLRIDCSVDVLYSFKTYILQQTAIISRYESNESPFLIDEKAPRLPTSTFINRSFDTLFPFGYPTFGTTAQGKIIEPKCFIVTLATYNPNQTETNTAQPTTQQYLLNNPQSTYTINGTSGKSYVMDKTGIRELMTYLTTNTGDAFTFIKKAQYAQSTEGIISIIAYPFEIPHGPNLELMTMFNEVIGNIQAYPLTVYPQSIYNCGKIALSSIGLSSYQDFEPYSRYWVYLPFVGYVDIEATELYEGGLSLQYIVDYMTGECEALLENYNSTRIIKTYHGQMGVNVPLTSSNAIEQARNGLTAIANFVSGTVATVGGLASANPVAVGGGVLGLARAGVSMATNALTMRGGSYPSEISRHMPKNPILLKQSQNFAIPSNYASTVGYPSMKSHSLNTLSGYAEIATIHLSGIQGATIGEIDEIERLLKDGVIF